MYHFKMKEELMDITANPFDKESSVSKQKSTCVVYTLVYLQLGYIF